MDKLFQDDPPDLVPKIDCEKEKLHHIVCLSLMIDGSDVCGYMNWINAFLELMWVWL